MHKRICIMVYLVWSYNDVIINNDTYQYGILLLLLLYYLSLSGIILIRIFLLHYIFRTF